MVAVVEVVEVEEVAAGEAGGLLVFEGQEDLVHGLAGVEVVADEAAGIVGMVGMAGMVDMVDTVVDIVDHTIFVDGVDAFGMQDLATGYGQHGVAIGIQD